jgi:hypothetical protein
MNFPLPAEEIAEIVAAGVCRDQQAQIRANVLANWPLLEAALDKRQIFSEMTAVAAIGTVATECSVFAPVKEKGGPQYLASLYEGRKDLGNTQPGDGVRFRGRGFIQITGRWDYTHFGEELGEGLAATPDLALDPRVAAGILAVYFHERHIPAYADEKMWDVVRRRVNGGLNGYPRFIAVVTKILQALEQHPLPSPTETKHA